MHSSTPPSRQACLARDFNGDKKEGAGYFQLTVNRGRRSSAATAFLRPASSRSNLAVVTGALAERLELEGARVSGVHYQLDGRSRLARCQREVIVCAGAINSPHLLQLSGIGDPDDLQRAGITVRHALPAVGKHLQDHIQARAVFKTRRPNTINDQVRWLPQRALGSLADLSLHADHGIQTQQRKRRLRIIKRYAAICDAFDNRRERGGVDFQPDRCSGERIHRRLDHLVHLQRVGPERLVAKCVLHILILLNPRARTQTGEMNARLAGMRRGIQ